MTGTLRVGIVADYLEEGWPSMDLVAEMLAQYVPEADEGIEVELLRPAFVRRLGWFVHPGASGEWTKDRVINRFWDYPRWLARRATAFDVLHIVDHSYAHLVHSAGGVPCLITLHDLDAFGSLLGSAERGLPAPLVRHQLNGLRRADAITCVSATVHEQLRSSALVPSARLQVVSNGVHPSCSPLPDACADRRVADRLGPEGRRVELLHVGSVIPRKRIDVLLRVLALVAGRHPSVVLIRVGGDLTDAQRSEAHRLGVAERIISLPRLERNELAAVYRRAALVLLPSEREGFGLPVVEALACGTPVILSDLPVLRELAGDAAELVPVGDADAWAARVGWLIEQRRDGPAWQERRERGMRAAGAYSWAASASRYAASYRLLAGAGRAAREAVA